MSGRIEVHGMRQLRAGLKKAGADLRDLTPVHRDVARIAEPAARSRAPRRSGKLAGNIRTGATRTAALLRAGGAAVPYAGPIHYGWPSRPNPARGWRGGPIKAHPFLIEGAQAERAAIIARYESLLEKTIARIAAETNGA